MRQETSRFLQDVPCLFLPPVCSGHCDVVHAYHQCPERLNTCRHCRGSTVSSRACVLRVSLFPAATTKTYVQSITLNHTRLRLHAFVCACAPMPDIHGCAFQFFESHVHLQPCAAGAKLVREFACTRGYAPCYFPSPLFVPMCWCVCLLLLRFCASDPSPDLLWVDVLVHISPAVRAANLTLSISTPSGPADRLAYLPCPTCPALPALRYLLCPALRALWRNVERVLCAVALAAIIRECCVGS